MNLEAHAVPGRVREVFRQPLLLQELTSCRIDLAHTSSGSHGLEPGLLRFPYCFVYSAGFARRTADVYGPRPVRTIASEYNTEVQDHEPVGRDGLVRSPPMRQGRALPRGNDGR